MEILKESRNELLKRNEISFLVEPGKTPSFDEMKKQLADEKKKPEEAIDVYNIKGKFGKKTFLVKANIYDNKKNMQEIKDLSKTKKQKKAEEEAKKKAEEEAKKAEEEKNKPQEAPAEATVEKSE